MSDSSEVKDLLFFHIHHPSSQIFRFQQFCLYFLTEWMVYFSNMIWWFYFPDFYPVSEFLLDFRDISKNLDFSDFDYISEQNGWFTSQIWYDDFNFRKFIRFSDFSGFSGFFQNFLSFNHISLQKFLFTFKIWYDDFIPRFRFFPYFSGIFSFSLRFNNISTQNILSISHILF